MAFQDQNRLGLFRAEKQKQMRKTKWYCQICEKQTWSDRGYMRHCASPSHQRRMKTYLKHQVKFEAMYSRKFKRHFLELLKTRFANQKVEANLVYQEFIQDRNHIHLNATKWKTLAKFVQWLGESGKCKVEESELRGWMIEYISVEGTVDRFKRVSEKRKLQAKEKAQLSEEQRQQKALRKQMRAAKRVNKALGRDKEDDDVKPLIPRAQALEPGKKDGVEEKVAFSFTPIVRKKVPTVFFGDEKDKDEKKEKKEKKRKREDDSYDDSRSPKKVKKKAVDDRKERVRDERRDYWLVPGIVVKIISKKIMCGKCYKAKGTVIDLIDKYTGLVKVQVGNDIMKIKVDQNALETVIPTVGRRVKIVNGKYRGETAEVLKANFDDFNCTVQILTGVAKSVELDKQYEDICKIAG